MSREPQQDAWLTRTLRQSPPAATDACLDAETLAAWADGGLTGHAAAAAELHASNCARCMAVLASLERSAPTGVAGGVWTRGGLLRWLVPLTAAATALAIWIAVPDRPVTPERPAELQQGPVQVPVPVPVPRASERAPEQRALDQAAERMERAAEPTAREDKLRLEAPSAAPMATPAAPPAARPETAADAAAARAFNAIPLVESVAPVNPQWRWRVVAATSIERSTDGGATWMSVGPVSGDAIATTSVSIIGLRAVDARRAVVRTSDDREFYTADGGDSWTPVQENSKAPF
jgi:hypothetical protein